MDAQEVVPVREAEARACKRNSSFAMRRMPALAEPGPRESTKGWTLEGTTGSRPYKALKGDRQMNRW